MAEGVVIADQAAEFTICPIADGGDGTLDALVTATGGEKIQVNIADPLGRPIQASFGLLGTGSRAVIEMAEASGLRLLGTEERNPLVTNTLGTGELMKAAMDRGAGTLIIGIGGSATVDGGKGMARALGYRFLNKMGADLSDGGGSLFELDCIDASGVDPRLESTQVWIASDVTNPLLGQDGAARIFGTQKGATPEMVEHLEKGLSRLAEVIERDLKINVRKVPGAGAAGGLGAGLMVFAHAKYRSGVELVLQEAGFYEKLEGVDLVLTGEGQVDHQTAFGKGPAGIAEAAKERGIPVHCLTGAIEPGAEEDLLKIGIARTYCINPPDSPLEDNLKNAYSRVREATTEVIKNNSSG